MKLIDYLPPFLKNVREYKEIFRVVDDELEILSNRIDNILREVRINTAESYGLDRYEKIYGISNDTTDIATRRYNILNKKNNKLPYSLRWLIHKLDSTVGKENYILKIDYNNRKIRIEIMSLYQNIAVSLNKDLREQLPANMIIEVVLFQTESSNKYSAGVVHIGKFVEIRQVM